MRFVIQRVNSSSVSVNGKLISKISKGLCILVGIGLNDSDDDLKWGSKKCMNIRLWKNENGKHWRAGLKDFKYEVLLISQFTLYARMKGNKPDFRHAKESKEAKKMFNRFVEMCKKEYEDDKVKVGAFGEYMDVKIQNDGPVTIILDSKDRKK